MGFFDLHCCYSGIALTGDTQLILLVKRDQQWQPISAPLRSFYDRLGGLDDPYSDDPETLRPFSAFTSWAEQHLAAGNLQEALGSMRDLAGRWNGQDLHYALIDAEIYHALDGGLVAADPQLPEDIRVDWKAAILGINPVDLEDSEQYCGLEGDFGCRARVDAALKRFADQPAIVDAIEGNAEEWRELDEE